MKSNVDLEIMLGITDQECLSIVCVVIYILLLCMYARLCLEQSRPLFSITSPLYFLDSLSLIQLDWLDGELRRSTGPCFPLSAGVKEVTTGSSLYRGARDPNSASALLTEPFSQAQVPVVSALSSTLGPRQHNRPGMV